MCAPWDESNLAADATRRKLRFGQLAAAYGMAAGGSVAASLAAAEDAADAALRALRSGASPEEAAFGTAVPRGMVLHMLRVASSSAPRARRKCATDGGIASVALVMARAAVDGASARAVNEAIRRATSDPPALAQLAQLIRRSMVGGYSSCVRRPSAATRARLTSLDDSELVEAVMGVGRDAPIGSAAMVEHAAAMEDMSVTKMASMCGGDARWDARVDRARLVMETLRGGLDTSWSADLTLQAAITGSAVADAVRRAHRRTTAPTGPNDRPAPAAWVHAEAAASGGASDTAVLARIIAGEAPELALAGVTPRAAEACLRGDCSALEADERAALADAVRTMHCARRIRVVRLCRDPTPVAAARDVVVCMGCFAVKNFVNRRGDEPRAASACGFRDMMPANRLFNVKEPRCTAHIQCASAPLFTVRLVAASGALMVDDRVIVVSACCGLVCTAAAVMPRVDGSWRCGACLR